MHQRKNYYRRNPFSIGPFIVILLLLALAFASMYLFSPAKEASDIPENAAAGTASAIMAADEIAAVQPTPTPPPAPGTLLESGMNLNEGYYKKFDFSGAASELTENSLVLGKEHPATNTKTGQDHPGSLLIHYDADTVVKTALLYYPADRYEIFMGCADDLQAGAEALFEIILEDPDASELRASEIVVSSFVFN